MGAFGWERSQGLVSELLEKRVCFMFLYEQTLLIFIKDRTCFSCDGLQEGQYIDKLFRAYVVNRRDFFKANRLY